MGELGTWCKRTSFEHGLRIPFIIHLPDKQNTWGKTISNLVEALDLYPTLVEAAGTSNRNCVFVYVYVNVSIEMVIFFLKVIVLFVG